MATARGFSLVEVLVVVGVIGLAAAVAIPSLNNALERNKVFTSTSLLGAQIREARLLAITRNQPFRVRFDCPTPGAVRVLAVTGNPVVDNAGNRCQTTQPNDGPPIYFPPNVTLGNGGLTALEVNGRGLVAGIGGTMPHTVSVSYGTFTRRLVVSATGNIQTPDR